MPIHKKEKERPKAANPQEARALYDYKLAKKYPFLEVRGYDYDEMTDFRTYGKFVRPDNLPVARFYASDEAAFFLHSTVLLPNNTKGYIFVHVIKQFSSVSIRGMMFEDSTSAYRYAYAHGCSIIKKMELEMAILEFMQAETEDLDLFVDWVVPYEDEKKTSYGEDGSKRKKKAKTLVTIGDA